MESKFHDAREEMRTLTVERRKAEAEELRVAVVSLWMERRCQKSKALKVKSWILQERQHGGAQRSLRSVLTRARPQGAKVLCAVLGARSKWKTVVRKESADTQEYEPCQQNDMDLDMDENKEELCFSKCGKRFGWMT